MATVGGWRRERNSAVTVVVIGQSAPANRPRRGGIARDNAAPSSTWPTPDISHLGQGPQPKDGDRLISFSPFNYIRLVLAGCCDPTSLRLASLRKRGKCACSDFSAAPDFAGKMASGGWGSAWSTEEGRQKNVRQKDDRESRSI
ncbi:MAG: hypothetical protein EXS37_09445 [Opitutus sp.]|nr:hypothetical protein [Opitutus sp.]